jgi:hypothetical protein
VSYAGIKAVCQDHGQKLAYYKQRTKPIFYNAEMHSFSAIEIYCHVHSGTIQVSAKNAIYIPMH